MLERIRDLSTELHFKFKSIQYVSVKDALFPSQRLDLDGLKEQVTYHWQDGEVPMATGEPNEPKMDTSGTLDLIDEYFGEGSLAGVLKGTCYVPTPEYLDLLLTERRQEVIDSDEYNDPNHHEEVDRYMKKLEDKSREIENSGAPLCSVVRDDTTSLSTSQALEGRYTTAKDALDIINELVAISD